MSDDLIGFPLGRYAIEPSSKLPTLMINDHGTLFTESSYLCFSHRMGMNIVRAFNSANNQYCYRYSTPVMVGLPISWPSHLPWPFSRPYCTYQ